MRVCMALHVWCGLFAWCVGIGALVVGQSRIESEFPPSPKGDGSFRAPALQSLGWVARLGGSLYLRASLPSLSLWDISPPRERLFFICMLCLCLLFPRGTAFLGLLLCSRWGGGGCFSFLILVDVQKNPTPFQEWDF